VPQSARVLNAWLGGKDRYSADRDVAAMVIEQRPQVVAAARANRLFLNRAVRYTAQRHAVTQVVPVSEWRPDVIVRQVVDLYAGVVPASARRW
jgi:hypothetical protein